MLETLATGDGTMFRLMSICTDPLDGTIIGVRNNHQVDRIDLTTGKVTPVCAGPAQVTTVDWHPDNRRAASGGWDSRFAIWNIEQPGRNTSTRTSDGYLTLGWSPDGSTLATGGASHTCTFWSDSGRRLGDVTRLTANDTTALAFGQSSDQFIRGGRGSGLRLHSLQNGRFTDLCKGDIYSLDFSTKTDHFAAGTGTGEILLWSSKGELGAVLQGHTFYVNDVAWRPAGWELASVATVNSHGAPELFLWTWGDSRPQRLPLSETAGNCLAWSPDGEVLAVGGEDGTIRRIRPGSNVSTAKSLDTLKGHFRRVTSIDWSSDGKFLISGGNDGTVRLWDAEKGRHLWVGIPLPDGTAAIFSTAGELLYGDSAIVDRQFVYMIKDADGNLELLTHSQFQQRLSASEHPE